MLANLNWTAGFSQPTMFVDIVINRNARRLAADGRLKRTLLAAPKVRGGSARVHQTRSLGELDRVMREIAARGTDAVVLAGGDGSHMAGVTALCRAFGDALPPIALAPCGTVGTVARNFGIRGTALGWTERLIRAACTGAFRVLQKPTLHVCDDDGGNRVGFIFGAGLVARFFGDYEDSPRQGLGVAASIAMRVFVGSFVDSQLARRILAPTGCSVWVDDSAHAARAWTLVLASVVRDLGLHLLATYRAGERLDQFHVVASGLSPRALGPQMLRVLAGLHLRGDPHIDTLTRSLRVRFDETRDAAYVLDGDIFRAREARVDAGPLLPLLVPL
jgi:diacylglycerol kinase family enzyme